MASAHGKRYTDETREALRQDYAAGASLQETATKHGVAIGTASLWTKDLPRHQRTYPPRVTPKIIRRRAEPLELRVLGYNTKHVGDISEIAIALELLKRGFGVLKPIGDNLRYDLIVDVQDHLLRIQCKTAFYTTRKVIHVPLISSYGHRGRPKKGYHGEVEAVIAYCHETGELFVIHGDLLKQTAVELRPPGVEGLPGKGRSSTDYTLDNFLKTMLL